MQLGASLPVGDIGTGPAVLRDYAQAAEGLGYTYLLGPDHVLGGNPNVDYGGKRVGTIMGTISIGAGLGSAIGSWAGGLIHDWAQSYDPVFVFAMGSVVIGMMPFLIAPALRR